MLRADGGNLRPEPIGGGALCLDLTMSNRCKHLGTRMRFAHGEIQPTELLRYKIVRTRPPFNDRHIGHAALFGRGT